MPGKILGIDINGDSVTAVQVEGGLRGYSIKGFARVVIEEAGGLDEALTALGQQMDLTADTSISTIPEELISYRNLQLPFTDAKKIRQALPFSIETMVPFPIEDVLVDFTAIDQSGQSEIFAASARRTDITEHLTHLQNHGIDPAVLDVRCVPMVLCLLRQAGIPDDGLLVEIGLMKGTMLLYQKRHISLIRAFPFGEGRLTQAMSNVPDGNHGETPTDVNIESRLRLFCMDIQNTLRVFEPQNKRIIEPDKVFTTGSGNLYPETKNLLEEFLEVPVQRINLAKDAGVQIDEDLAQDWNPVLMDSALASALRDTKQGLGFNLRRDEFEIKKKHFRLTKELRRVGVLLIIILSLLTADLGVDHYFLKRRYRMLDKQIADIFRQTLPEVKRMVDPVQQMRVKINEIKRPALTLPGINGDRKVIDLLRDISRGVPGSLDVKVTRMVVDPEAVQISGVTDSFNTVDSIKKGLEPSEYFSAVTISSANLDRSGNRVKFEVKLKRVK